MAPRGGKKHVFSPLKNDVPLVILQIRTNLLCIYIYMCVCISLSLYIIISCNSTTFSCTNLWFNLNRGKAPGSNKCIWETARLVALKAFLNRAYNKHICQSNISSKSGILGLVSSNLPNNAPPLNGMHKSIYSTGHAKASSRVHNIAALRIKTSLCTIGMSCPVRNRCQSQTCLKDSKRSLAKCDWFYLHDRAMTFVSPHFTYMYLCIYIRRNKVYASWKLDKASISVNRGSHFEVHFAWQLWDGQLSPAFKSIRLKAFGGWKFDRGTTKLHARILRGKGVQKKKPNVFTAGSSTSATFVLPVYIYIYTVQYTVYHWFTYMFLLGMLI